MGLFCVLNCFIFELFGRNAIINVVLLIILIKFAFIQVLSFDFDCLLQGKEQFLFVGFWRDLNLDW